MEFAWLLLVINCLIWLLIQLNDLKHRRKIGEHWHPLAAQNGLSFRLSDRSGLPIISGTYRNYNLTITVPVKSSSKSRVYCTRIAISRKLLKEVSKSNPQMDLKVAVRRFTEVNPAYLLIGKVRAAPGGRTLFYEQDEMEKDLDYLQYVIDLLSDLADAYPHIIAWGGKAAPFLEKPAHLAIIKGNNGLRPIAIQLLQEIAGDTARLAPQLQSFWCAACLARCVSHKVQLSAVSAVTYYGCRLCGESQAPLLIEAAKAVAKLDNTMAEECCQKGQVIYVNWLKRRTLFDFDAVEIIQATDEEIERFAVQVGNDTDQFRASQYKQMTCFVLAGFHLSINTQRVLQQIFGKVELTELV